MSTVELAAPSLSRLLTVADLAALPEELPSGPVDYELDNGRLIIMSPAGRRHGSLQVRLAGYFLVHGEWQGRGEVYSEVGVVLGRNPDSVVGPDVAFVSASRFPVRETPEGYLETMPDVVVEVRSKNDSRKELAAKAADYLRAGVQTVWLVDAEDRTITVHAPHSAPVVYGPSDVVPTPFLNPEFAFSVGQLFEPMAKQ